MTGTSKQIEWAEEIKLKIEAEFDRVASALRASSEKQTEKDRADTQAVIAILEEKRGEVMANGQAGYFIRQWQNSPDHQVRQLIAQDARYLALKAKRSGRPLTEQCIPVVK